MPSEDSPDLERLLTYLKRARGFDFTGYKRSSVMRRIDKRMESVDISGYADYLDHLEVNPEEFAFLFNTILINVTGFFRDPAAWDHIRTTAIPKLLAEKGAAEPIRVWSAGCSSGEEALTIAMLLAEALGEEAFLKRVKIYATDVDEEALDTARQAVYPAKSLEAVPSATRDRFFDRVDQRFVFRKDLRRAVIYGRNDLVQDAPISRVDLLLCRNTLMYFNAETQAQIVRRLHFALAPHGHLFLGKSEMLVAHGELFAAEDLKQRVFVRVGQPGLRERLLASPRPDGDEQRMVRESAFDTAPVAQLVVNHDGVVVLANERARALLRLSEQDAGRPLKDLEASYRPVDLRSALEEAYGAQRVVTAPRVSYAPHGQDARILEVQVAPLYEGGDLLGASVTFEDVTRLRETEDDATRAKEELSSAYEELQSMVEELETTNEELQSTNEELETTNEELQSTNEELETTNEELQSSNEELETMNDELRTRSLEIDESNAFMETVLQAMEVAVTVVDQDLRVQLWNSHSEELWGLRREEVESIKLADVDFGIDNGRLIELARECLAPDNGKRLFDELAATDRRGRSFTCRTTVVPLNGHNGRTGVILLLERERPLAVQDVSSVS